MSDINYKCTIVSIKNLQPLNGLDNLLGTNIFGNQILVGKETKEGDLGLYFPAESQLGEDFCKVNNLYRDNTLNIDPLAKGMFDVNRRVRVQKFKGNPSSGFWIPINSLKYLTDNVPKEGESFNEWYGFEISKKYIPKFNKSGLKNRVQVPKKWSRVIKEYFPEHIDTEHLFKNLDKIKPGNLLVFTWKLHGTSFRVGNVPVKRILNPLEKLLKFFGIRIQETEFAYLNGSRKVVKDSNNPHQNHYYEKDLWTEIGNSYFKDKLFTNEMVFGEIIGYVPGSNELIQKGFTYGCKPGTCEVYIYRITRDGVDLSWEAVKQRSTELGIKHVPEIGIKRDVIPDKFFYDKVIPIELQVKEYYLEQNSILDPSHPEEGIVCRIEGLIPQFYKAKSFKFMEMETKQLDKGEQDLETVESEENS